MLPMPISLHMMPFRFSAFILPRENYTISLFCSCKDYIFIKQFFKITSYGSTNSSKLLFFVYFKMLFGLKRKAKHPNTYIFSKFPNAQKQCVNLGLVAVWLTKHWQKSCNVCRLFRVTKKLFVERFIDDEFINVIFQLCSLFTCIK